MMNREALTNLIKITQRSKKLLVILILLLSSKTMMAQNQINLGQYMIHQPFINPAAVGSYQNLTFAAVYRAQWTQFTGAPVTQGLNIIAPLKKLKHTLGLNIYHDVIGINNNTEISLAYAYTSRIGRNSFLCFGLGASVDLLKSDYNLLYTITPEDPLFVSNTGVTPLPDFKFGIYFFKSKFYAGFSLPNLLNNQIEFTTDGASVGKTEFSGENLHYHFHTGYSFLLNEKFDLNASTLLKQVSGSPLQVDGNLQLMYKKTFGMGVSYRTSKEIIGILSYNINTTFKFSYAYEFNTGLLGNYSNGSHEIMLIYSIKPPKETVVSIPRF